ncbi:MAG TPA: hypothetical protein VHO29_06135, partial [Marmoricola sp.]|nr:hypothetical protein [Marmoricola sp.]
MPEPTEGNPLAAFGANEWLVDEMYEQYQKDPRSVDPAWWDFFKNYRNGSSAKEPAAVSPSARTTQAPQQAAQQQTQQTTTSASVSS